MEAVVSDDINELNAISSRLHIALNNGPVRYIAMYYGIPFQHPNEQIFALVIAERMDYRDIIMETLTQEEKDKIETLTDDWFNLE